MMHLLNSKALILPPALMLGGLFCYIFHSYRLANDVIPESHKFHLMASDQLANDVIPESHKFHLMASDQLLYEQPSILHGRSDVVTVTPWLAPVVWEGTFDPRLLDSVYRLQNITVTATVFAVGKYVMFLKSFLETAERHFFVGFKVHIYVFTDRVDEVPRVRMAAGRQLTVRSVPGSERWQEISARRMELVQRLLEELLEELPPPPGPPGPPRLHLLPGRGLSLPRPLGLRVAGRPGGRDTPGLLPGPPQPLPLRAPARLQGLPGAGPGGLLLLRGGLRGPPAGGAPARQDMPPQL